MNLFLIPGAFLILFILERVIPQVDKSIVKKGHDKSNIGLGLINLSLGRIFSVFTVFALSDFISDNNIGLFNVLNTGYRANLFFLLLVLDLLNYWWHRLVHTVPFLWNLHNIHHTDRLLNVSSALRFHIFEIILGSLFKLPFIILLGIPLNALLLYEIILNLNVYFHHSNIRVNDKLDSVLSVIVITPSIHRVHHSLRLKKSYNFSSVLVIWDKIFSSFHIKEDSNNLKYGVPGYSDDKYQSFLYMLKQPFIKNKNGWWFSLFFILNCILSVIYTLVSLLILE